MVSPVDSANRDHSLLFFLAIMFATLFGNSRPVRRFCFNPKRREVFGSSVLHFMCNFGVLVGMYV